MKENQTNPALIKSRKIKMDTSQKITFIVYGLIFVIFSVLCLYPLFWVFGNSLKGYEELKESSIALPKSFDLSIYQGVLSFTSSSFTAVRVGFWGMAFNSIWMAFGGQAINLLASICVAYPLARYKFPFKNFFYAIIIFRITIPVVGSGPASYKFMRALNFLNNPAPFMLTYFTGFDMMALILYGYFKGISKDYSEAAYIDGASRLRTFFTIILPQAMPCILALYINQVMGAWNNFSTTQIYLHSYPNLAYGIYNRLNKKMDPQFFAAVFMSSLVPLTLFGAFQKTMLTNMSVGGLKG